MLRSLTAILLTLLICSFGAKELTIYLLFKWNQQAIAQERCINLDAPQVMCNGKCFLGQQLIELSVEQNENGEQFPQISLEIAKVFYELTTVLTLDETAVFKKHLANFSYQTLVTNPVTPALFRPPVSC